MSEAPESDVTIGAATFNRMCEDAVKQDKTIERYRNAIDDALYWVRAEFYGNAECALKDAQLSVHKQGEVMKERCANCKYWKKVNAWGKCRRRSPITYLYGEDLQTEWPETCLDKWCGEWKPIEPGE